MIITELTTIEYLEFVKNIFRDNNFKFLLFAVARYGDNKKYFNELEEYWASIDNLTSNKVVFLNFTSNKIENEDSYLDFGSGEKIFSKGIKTIKNYDIQTVIENLSRAGSYKRQALEYNSKYFWVEYLRELEFIKLKYLPKLHERLSNTIDENATELLEYLHKKESDVPFLYLFDLKNNIEYCFSIIDIYLNYNSLYDFIKSLSIQMENEIQLKEDSENYNDQISKIISELQSRQKRLISKKKQLDSISTEFSEIKSYYNAEKLTPEQAFYIESIINKKRYELEIPLKNLFPNKEINRIHINSIILKYSNKDLKGLEKNLLDWIEGENEKLIKDTFESESSILKLKEQIILNTNKLQRYFDILLIKQNFSNDRKINKFKVALTYAGENRGYVEQVAINLELKVGKGNIFYDSFFQAELARMDLDIYLQDIYHNKSDFIVVFLSKDYETKEWCGLEWRSIRDLIKNKEGNKIILVKLSEFNLGGIFSIDGFLDGMKNDPLTISELIKRRICT